VEEVAALGLMAAMFRAQPLFVARFEGCVRERTLSDEKRAHSIHLWADPRKESKVGISIRSN
jgi:hypothetical protein